MLLKYCKCHAIRHFERLSRDNWTLLLRLMWESDKKGGKARERERERRRVSEGNKAWRRRRRRTSWYPHSGLSSHSHWSRECECESENTWNVLRTAVLKANVRVPLRRTRSECSCTQIHLWERRNEYTHRSPNTSNQWGERRAFSSTERNHNSSGDSTITISLWYIATWSPSPINLFHCSPIKTTTVL